MTEAKMRVKATAGLAAPPFHPILPDAGGGPTFTMLGTTMRLIATATGTGGRYTVMEQVTPAGWGPPRHIHSCDDEIFYILDGSYPERIWTLCFAFEINDKEACVAF